MPRARLPSARVSSSDVLVNRNALNHQGNRQGFLADEFARTLLDASALDPRWVFNKGADAQGVDDWAAKASAAEQYLGKLETFDRALFEHVIPILARRPLQLAAVSIRAIGGPACSPDALRAAIASMQAVTYLLFVPDPSDGSRLHHTIARDVSDVAHGCVKSGMLQALSSACGANPSQPIKLIKTAASLVSGLLFVAQELCRQSMEGGHGYSDDSELDEADDRSDAASDCSGEPQQRAQDFLRPLLAALSSSHLLEHLSRLLTLRMPSLYQAMAAEGAAPSGSGAVPAETSTEAAVSSAVSAVMTACEAVTGAVSHAESYWEDDPTEYRILGPNCQFLMATHLGAQLRALEEGVAAASAGREGASGSRSAAAAAASTSGAGGAASSRWYGLAPELLPPRVVDEGCPSSCSGVCARPVGALSPTAVIAILRFWRVPPPDQPAHFQLLGPRAKYELALRLARGSIECWEATSGRLGAAGAEAPPEASTETAAAGTSAPAPPLAAPPQRPLTQKQLRQARQQATGAQRQAAAPAAAQARKPSAKADGYRVAVLMGVRKFWRDHCVAVAATALDVACRAQVAVRSRRSSSANDAMPPRDAPPPALPEELWRLAAHVLCMAGAQEGLLLDRTGWRAIDGFLTTFLRVLPVASLGPPPLDVHHCEDTSVWEAAYAELPLPLPQSSEAQRLRTALAPCLASGLVGALERIVRDAPTGSLIKGTWLRDIACAAVRLVPYAEPRQVGGLLVAYGKVVRSLAAACRTPEWREAPVGVHMEFMAAMCRAAHDAGVLYPPAAVTAAADGLHAAAAGSAAAAEHRRTLDAVSLLMARWLPLVRRVLHCMRSLDCISVAPMLGGWCTATFHALAWVPAIVSAYEAAAARGDAAAAADWRALLLDGEGGMDAPGLLQVAAAAWERDAEGAMELADRKSASHRTEMAAFTGAAVCLSLLFPARVFSAPAALYRAFTCGARIPCSPAGAPPTLRDLIRTALGPTSAHPSPEALQQLGALWAPGRAPEVGAAAAAAAAAVRSTFLEPLARVSAALLPPHAAARLLPCCANPACTNLSGGAEAALPLTPCRHGCGCAYCSPACQAAHAVHADVCAALRAASSAR